MPQGTGDPASDGWLLLADDSERLRSMLARMLTSAGAVGEVVEVGDAEQALTRLDERTAPALVVLDVNMPGRSGLDVLPEVRRRCPYSFIAVLTGLSAGEVEQACLDGGADMYLPKDSGLAAAVAVLMARWALHREALRDIWPDDTGILPVSH